MANLQVEHISSGKETSFPCLKEKKSKLNEIYFPLSATKSYWITILMIWRFDWRKWTVEG